MRNFKLVIGLLGVAIFLASCANSSKNYFGPYSQAEKFYQNGKYEKAIGKYQEYLASNPQGNMAAIAEYYIAKSYRALNKTAEAKTGFQQVIERYPETSWANFSKTQLETLGS